MPVAAPCAANCMSAPLPEARTRQREVPRCFGKGFLMYPQAETSDGRLDSLDADNFKYEITSKETT